MSKKSTELPSIEKNDFKLPKLFQELTLNNHLLHLNYLRQTSNARRGTASCKTRAEVRGGGAKPWKQKGTGRARAGSIRSPLWVGGGVIFGPKPRDYSFSIPLKERNIGIAHAIVGKKENIILIKKVPEIKDLKTKIVSMILDSLDLSDKRVLFVGSSDEKNFPELKIAARNLKKVTVKEWEYIGVKELINADTVIFTEDAFRNLEQKLSVFISKSSKTKKVKKGAA